MLSYWHFVSDNDVYTRITVTKLTLILQTQLWPNTPGSKKYTHTLTYSSLISHSHSNEKKSLLLLHHSMTFPSSAESPSVHSHCPSYYHTTFCTWAPPISFAALYRRSPLPSVHLVYYTITLTFSIRAQPTTTESPYHIPLFWLNRSSSQKNTRNPSRNRFLWLTVSHLTTAIRSEYNSLPWIILSHVTILFHLHFLWHSSILRNSLCHMN